MADSEWYDKACELLDRKEYAEAMPCFKKAIEEGDVRAFFDVGCMYIEGIGVEKDEKQAFYYFQKGAKAGNPDCAGALGCCYLLPIGVDIDLQKAAFYFEKAAKAGNVTAMANLGKCYEDGFGVSKNLEKALYWLEKAADLDFIPAIVELGNIYFDGDLVVRDLEKAFGYYSRAAEEGDPLGKLEVAKFYEKGLFIAKDLEKAKALYLEAYDAFYELAATEDDEHAQLIMGNFYMDGLPLIGIEQDYAQAAIWYEKSAGKGYFWALNPIGCLYKFGLGVIKNHEKSFNWFFQGAQKGIMPCLNNVANCYYNGEGVPKDFQKAAEYFIKAAQLGDPSSQMKVGYMYMKGEGVEQDFTQAVRWLKESCKKGYSSAFALLGDFYFHGLGVDKDQEEAFRLYQEGAKRDDLEAKVSMAECLIEGWGTKCNFNQAREILESVCNDEKEYRETPVSLIIRDGTWVNPYNKTYSNLYAKAYYLLGLLYDAQRGAGKAEPYKALAMLRMAEKLGYKGEGRPLSKLIAEVEGACNLNCQLEIRKGRRPRIRKYHIFIHHADGSEEEIQFNSNRQKFCYMLMMFFASNASDKGSMPGLTAAYFCYARERLVSLAMETGMKPINFEAEIWIDEFIYKKGYKYDPQTYSNEFTNSKLRLSESMSEDELEFFGVKSVKRTSEEVNIKYIAASPEQIIIPTELQKYACNLPTMESMRQFKAYSQRTADYSKFLQRYEEELEDWPEGGLANE